MRKVQHNFNIYYTTANNSVLVEHQINLERPHLPQYYF